MASAFTIHQMRISEPMTMATDYALAALAAWYGWRLASGGETLSRAKRYWAYACFALAIGAILGGTSHGFALMLSGSVERWVWTATTFAIGFASFFLLAGSGYATLRRRAAQALAALALLKLAVYLVWMSSHDEFMYVIADYAPSMAVVLALNLYLWLGLRQPAGAWIASGVMVSFAAAGVQLSGLTLHEHFNHNDLYHVVQMVGLMLFYLGARELRDRRPARRDRLQARAGTY